MINIRKLENELWESADLLRSGSNLTANEYCMPVMGLIFLRYAYSRFRLVETELMKNRPSRNGRVKPVEAADFISKSALYLPKEATVWAKSSIMLWSLLRDKAISSGAFCRRNILSFRMRY